MDAHQVQASNWTDCLAGLPQIPSVIINHLIWEWSPLSGPCRAASAVLCGRRDKRKMCANNAGTATCQGLTSCQCHLKLWLRSLKWAPSACWASLTLNLADVHLFFDLHNCSIFNVYDFYVNYCMLYKKNILSMINRNHKHYFSLHCYTTLLLWAAAVRCVLPTNGITLCVNISFMISKWFIVGWMEMDFTTPTASKTKSPKSI